MPLVITYLPSPIIKSFDKDPVYFWIYKVKWRFYTNAYLQTTPAFRSSKLSILTTRYLNNNSLSGFVCPNHRYSRQKNWSSVMHRACRVRNKLKTILNLVKLFESLCFPLSKFLEISKQKNRYQLASLKSFLKNIFFIHNIHFRVA